MKSLLKKIGMFGGMGILAISLASCGEKEPVKVGYTANMSELASDLGVDARNGVMLAVEEKNDEGGVKGHRIDLVIKDDKNDPAVASLVHEKFKQEEVQLVIGHLMSGLAESMLESESENMLFLTPSMSTDAFTGIDDYIFRACPLIDGQASLLVEDVLERGYTSIYIVYDGRNAMYARVLERMTREMCTESGIEVKGLFDISKATDDYASVAKDIARVQPDCLFMITSSIDTAFMAQRVRQLEEEAMQLYSVSWSMTRDMIENGGVSVEGMRMIGTYIPETLSEEYADFKAAFEERFGYEPTFIAEYGYDTAKILMQALETAGSFEPADVKAALVNMEYDGLYETIKFDQYGDTNRRYLIHVVKDGVFEPEWK